VRMATPTECVAVFGYPPGSMPPLGLRQSHTLTLVDPAVVRADEHTPWVHCGGGSPTMTLKLEPDVLLQSIPRPEVVPIARLEGPSLACAVKELELAEAAGTYASLTPQPHRAG
jgi:prolyl-tRNA editing enzyme YbaK/EbsC (Cys-tRNA(Pro) deacylase)